jgi:hypothetical protein
MVPTVLIDYTTLFTGAADALGAGLQAALPVAVPIGLGLIGLTIAWKVLKRFVRG